MRSFQSFFLLLSFQAGHIKAVVPVLKDLEDQICEEDERIQDFMDGKFFPIFLLDGIRDQVKSVKYLPNYLSSTHTYNHMVR